VSRYSGTRGISRLPCSPLTRCVSRFPRVQPAPAEAAGSPAPAAAAGGGAPGTPGGAVEPPSPGAGLFATATREQLVKMLTESAKKLKQFNSQSTSALP
jgi:hypothetical protein